MRKLLRSRKALSPVIAAIILIAVTVAVSIAVAAWMGAITIGFMRTEELKITGVKFKGTGENGTVDITVMNTGPVAVTIADVLIEGESQSGKWNLTVEMGSAEKTLDKGASGTITVTFSWEPGTRYEIAVMTTGGNKFSYPAYSP
jgi:flagellin-like protein